MGAYIRKEDHVLFLFFYREGNRAKDSEVIYSALEVDPKAANIHFNTTMDSTYMYTHMCISMCSA